jgi:Flp pilus assembly pilin Flp
MERRMSTEPETKTGPSLLARFAANDTAATSIEYALIGVVMALMLFASLPPIREQFLAVFTYMAAAIQLAIG